MLAGKTEAVSSVSSLQAHRSILQAEAHGPVSPWLACLPPVAHRPLTLTFLSQHLALQASGPETKATTCRRFPCHILRLIMSGLTRGSWPHKGERIRRSLAVWLKQKAYGGSKCGQGPGRHLSELCLTAKQTSEEKKTVSVPCHKILLYSYLL